MMNDRTVPDEFDVIVRSALHDVAAATHPDEALADVLVANTRSGRPVVASLAVWKRSRRWAFPLLAAASVAVLAVGVVVIAKVAADGHRVPAVQHHQHRTPKPPAPRAPALAHFHATDVFFSDSAHGWALGDGQCPGSGQTNCPALLSTSDGGTSWQVRTLPEALVSTFDFASCNLTIHVHGPCVDHLVFANSSDGYLWSSNAAYRTTDGGTTWARDVGSGDRWHGATQMIVAGNRVVRTAPDRACASGCADAVQTARLGTFDWHATFTRSRSVPLRLSVVGATVYLFAGRTQSAASTGIFRSSDGGQTWTQVARNACGRAPRPVYDPFAGGVAADDGALVAACITAPGGLRTAPPGSRTFSALRPYPARDVAYQLIGAQSAERIVVAKVARSFDPAKIRGRTVFCVTTNGGRTWRQTATIPPGGASLPYFTNGRVYATGASDLYVSNDGGTSWRRVPFNS